MFGLRSLNFLADVARRYALSDVIFQPWAIHSAHNLLRRFLSSQMRIVHRRMDLCDNGLREMFWQYKLCSYKAILIFCYTVHNIFYNSQAIIFAIKLALSFIFEFCNCRLVFSVLEDQFPYPLDVCVLVLLIFVTGIFLDDF